MICLDFKKVVIAISTPKILTTVLATSALLVAGCSSTEPETTTAPSTVAVVTAEETMTMEAMEQETTPVDAGEALPTVIVMDASATMLDEGNDETRYTQAKEAAVELVNNFPTSSELGVVVFGHNTDNAPESQVQGCEDVEVLRPLSSLEDAEVATAAIEALPARGYTPVTKAIEEAAKLLPADGPARIVVFSDGVDTCGGDIAQLTLKMTDEHPNVRVDAVTFKNDPAYLQVISEATGGTVTYANKA
ncbi:VWA domain-containing protein [Corynebacterium sp. ES2775-CONJ]|uniref:vWA domain-containing protein n=1 Tax=Corynebacterium sp. ES2775-CONJ TaxID=2974029 RepID=UPI0021698394|nr:VWA domain-containing protein [Corynebacterium sp. ES2775-CONJ]MCS4490194.1 VWA domain-containing protein [Corynebacterium sp. ES2775-CONJ]